METTIPKSKLRTAISLFILGFCYWKTDDLLLSFMVYLTYLCWAIVPVLIIDKEISKGGQPHDDQKN